MDDKIKISDVILSTIGSKPSELIRISGNSLAKNYLCVCENYEELFIKIYCAENSTFKLQQCLYANAVSMPKPMYEAEIEKNVFCAVYEYVRAFSADACLGRFSEETLASRISSELKKMHSLKAPYEVENIRFETQKLVRYIQNNSVCFSGEKEIIDYLTLHTVDVAEERIGFAHMDFHLKNVMIDKDKSNVIITDFENLAYGDTWRDFVYAAFFHEPRENLFWKAFIQSYFNNNIPQQFWESVKYYCYVQALRMIVCEHQKGNLNEIEKLAKSINTGFSIKALHPRWYKFM